MGRRGHSKPVNSSSLDTPLRHHRSVKASAISLQVKSANMISFFIFPSAQQRKPAKQKSAPPAGWGHTRRCGPAQPRRQRRRQEGKRRSVATNLERRQNLMHKAKCTL